MLHKNAKIYIAGHRGLVGSAIWKNLQEKGYTNLVGRTHKELDLLDGVAVRRFFDEEQPEYVFLAAAFVGGIMANSIYRADFIYKNLQIQQNVIGESFRHNVKKLLFLGSTCIYPRDAEQPMKEDVLLTSPLEYTNEPYAIAKIAGLKMCESFNLQYGTNYIAVMPTNLYGPNDNFDLERSHVLPAMIRKIHLAHCLQQGDWDAVRRDMNLRPVEGINGSNSNGEILDILSKYGISEEEVRLWGTGTPLREFLWSEEMADASVFVMEHVDFKDTCKPGDKDIRNCHINIGTGKEITIRRLAELIVSVVGYRGKLTFVEGLFLSSGVVRNPDYTMERLVRVAKDLRTIHRFNGYIHLKSIPGASRELVNEAGLYADRLSVNVEIPKEENLKLLAPEKDHKSVYAPMRYIQQGVLESSEERKKHRHAPRFAPAGQSTQMIVGATAETDKDILYLSSALYKGPTMRRVYYSGYISVNTYDKRLPALKQPPLVRENRLYQADWLMRFYQFKVEEIVDDAYPDLDLEVDPKLSWALRHPEQFPIDVNKVDYEMLLRVPGIGVKSARLIVASRRFSKIGFYQLKKIGVVMKKAQYFITCCELPMRTVNELTPQGVRSLLLPKTNRIT